MQLTGMGEIMIIRNGLDDVCRFEIDCNESMNLRLLDVVKPIGIVSAFPKYYVDDGCLLINGVFPYMLVDGVLMWNVSYDKVSLGDFLATHPQCLSDGIEYTTSIPAAGGHDRVIGKAAVGIVVSIVKQIRPELEMPLDTCEAVCAALTGLTSYYEEKEISVIQQLDALIATGEVGILAVKEILEFDDYYAGRLLRALGFKYDDSKGRYVIGVREKAMARVLLEKVRVEELRWL